MLDKEGHLCKEVVTCFEVHFAIQIKASGLRHGCYPPASLSWREPATPGAFVPDSPTGLDDAHQAEERVKMDGVFNLVKVQSHLHNTGSSLRRVSTGGLRRS